jgi:hypothetical protein
MFQIKRLKVAITVNLRGARGYDRQSQKRAKGFTCAKGKRWREACCTQVTGCWHGVAGAAGVAGCGLAHGLKGWQQSIRPSRSWRVMQCPLFGPDNQTARHPSANTGESPGRPIGASGTGRLTSAASVANLGVPGNFLNVADARLKLPDAPLGGMVLIGNQPRKRPWLSRNQR